METRKESTAVIDPSTMTTADVPTLLEKIEDKIKEITTEDSSIVGMEYPNYGLLEEQTPEDLLEIRAFVKERGRALEEGVKEMRAKGIHVSDKWKVKINGYTVDKWIDAVDKQYKITSQKAILKELKASRDKLKKYLTKEHQFQSDIKDIMDSIS